MTIRNKTLMWLLIPSILIASFVTTFWYLSARKEIKQNIIAGLEIAAEEAKEHIRLFLEAKKIRTVDFSSDGFIRDCTEEITGKERRKEYYTNALNDHLIINKKSLDTNILEILVIDFSGVVVASSDKNKVGKDVSNEEYFSKVKHLSAFAGDPHYDDHLNKVIIDFSTVLLSKVGREAVGVIVNKIMFEEELNEKQEGALSSQKDNLDHHELVIANKVRIMDFSSDGFIRDCMEEITKREDRVVYYASLLNTHLSVNKKSLDPELISVFIVDLDGKIIGSSETGLMGKDVSEETYFTNGIKKDCYVSELYNPVGEGHKTIDVSKRLLSKKGQEPIGVIVNRFSGESLKGITRSGILEELGQNKLLEGLGETGEIYVVNSGKTMITGSRFLRNAAMDQIVDTKGVRVALENGKGMFGIYHDYRGVPIIGVSRVVDEMDWIVLAEKDVSGAFAPIVRLRNFTIVMTLIGIAVIVSVAIFLATEITRPVKKLIEGTRRVAGGDLEHPVRIDKGKDEVKELGESFNLMMKKLKESKMFSVHSIGKDEPSPLHVKGRRDQWLDALDVITDVTTIHDKDFRIISANRAFYEKFSIDEKQLNEKKCYEIFHGTERPWHNCPLAKCATSLKPECEEVDDPNMGGIFLISTYPLLDEENKFHGVVQQISDITERKKAEEEIKKAKEYSENLIETAQDAIVCINEKGIINVWNQSAEKTFGYSKNEIIGQPVTIIIPEKYKKVYQKKQRRFLNTGEVNIIDKDKTIEVFGKTKKGTEISLELSLSFQKIDNEQYSFTGIIRDITFQKKLQRQYLDKANRLERTNKDLEDFVYIVSHDLKEPLFSIEGLRSRLSGSCGDVLGEKGKTYIERIGVNVKAMSTKVSEIMEVLKVGRIEYNFQNNDIKAIVNDVVKTLKSKIAENNINIINHDNLPTAMLCDKQRIKDVFSNLIINAIKFMGDDVPSGFSSGKSQAVLGRGQDGGLRQIRMGCDKDKKSYKFYVEDTGIGVRAEHQDQIFKIFRRLNDVDVEGTGVGLSIVKKIVEKHNGRIWIESPVSDGRGSRFCFTIPVSKEVERRAEGRW